MLPALITVAVFLVLTVALPILSFRRASAAREGVERLERRARRPGRSGAAEPVDEADAVSGAR